MAHAIECEALTKFYGRTRGVEDLTFAVPTGMTFGYLGPNGAGKTTTIRCLLGMLKATDGTMRVLGEAITLDGSSLRRRIGYVPGEVNLYEKETGRWHIDFISGLRGGPGASTTELLERLELDPSRRVRELSKGNKQKLSLVLALMHDPELLILDEPTSGLDPLNQETVFDILRERVDAGATLFLSSHILPEVEKVCERVGIIREGRLVAEEDVASLLRKRLQHLHVTFAQPVDERFFVGVEGVDDVARLGENALLATVKGDVIDAVVKRLAMREVTDISIEHASLEDVFMEFYRTTADEQTGPDAASSAEGGEAR